MAESITAEIAPPVRIDDLASKAAKEYNTLRFNFKNVEFLYKLPSRLLPVVKWLLHELNARVSYGRPDMPMTVGIETIAACNRSCSYCTVGKPEFKVSRTKFAMSDLTYEKVLSDLKDLPRKGSTHGFNGALFLNAYGEPMLDKKIVTRVALAGKYLPEAKIGLFSNGDFLTEDLFRQLAASGIDEVVLTPHDPSGRFKPEIYALERKYRDSGILRLKEPLSFLSNRGGQVAVPKEKLIAPVGRCVSPTYAFWVAADGAIGMCFNDSLLTTPQGNINERPLLKIWDNPGYASIRQALRHHDLSALPEICTKCRIGE